MRLLHCIRSLDPAGGGPIEALRQRVAALAQLGHSSEIASLDPAAMPGLANWPCPVYGLGLRSDGYGRSPHWIPWIRANAPRFTSVVVSGLWQYQALGTRQALGARGNFFVFPHGMLDPWFKRTYPLKHLKKWLYWPWADYRVLRDARAVLFTSEEERRLARESFWLYRCNERVVGYGTAGPQGDLVGRREAFLAKFPHLQSKRSLLFLGRVHEKKGPDLLFRALADVLKRLSKEITRDVHLVMAGPNDHDYGRQMAALAGRLGIADRITWTGMLAGDLKWGAFSAAEAFILPSHQENFGIAVAEALACGTPVLISNQVNIWREIDEDRAGYVENDDLPGTAALIERWLRTPEPDWLAMSERATSCFEKRFQIDNAARSLIKTIEECGVRARAP